MALAKLGRFSMSQLSRSLPLMKSTGSHQIGQVMVNKRQFTKNGYKLGMRLSHIAGRLGVAAAVGGAGGYGALMVAHDFYESLPKFPKFPQIQVPFHLFDVIGDGVNQFQDWMSQYEKQKGEFTVDPAALKKLISAPSVLMEPSPKQNKRQEEDQLMFVTKRLLEIRSSLNSLDILRLQLPTIVVIGSQSAGKSSVLEAIVGREFLPKGSNMVTRRPLELTLIHTPDSKEEYGEFPQLGFKKMSDFNEIKETLVKLNNSVPEQDHVSVEPIQLKIYSPFVPDLNLVDLPGYIRVTSSKQPPELRQKILELCRRYIQEPNIILAISAADVDLANSDALRESRKVDPTGIRTLGVLTKMDTIQPREGVNLLRHNDYDLSLGFIGVVNRPPKNRENRSIFEAEEDDEFFIQHDEFREKGVRVGVPKLRKELVKLLEQHMSESLGAILERVRSELDDTNYQLKVQFNDLRISEDAYLTQITDTIKTRFTTFSSTFGKKEVRTHIKTKLEDRIFAVLEDFYWNDPSIMSTSDVNYHPAPNPDKNGEYQNYRKLQFEQKDDADRSLDYLDYLVDRAASAMTRSGIGRMATNHVAQHLMNSLEEMLKSEPFEYHPEIQRRIKQFANELIRPRIQRTIEQVENNIKPLKYDIEISKHDWEVALVRTVTLLKEQIQKLTNDLRSFDTGSNARNLKEAVRSLESYYKRERELEKLRSQGVQVVQRDVSNKPLLHEELGLPQHIVERAKEYLQIQSKIRILNQRIRYIKKNGSKFEEAKSKCPEVYLEVVADQLARMSAMFIHCELLYDVYYHFPREITKALHLSLTDEEKAKIVKSNPKVKEHLELQDKRERLEYVKLQLEELRRVQQRTMDNEKRRRGGSDF